ncbi:MAG TPA: hypothetical protein VFB30_22705, partial [Spirochaetia bacterium]|nr:hypothetical protein [Spirochaetia bacterium]
MPICGEEAQNPKGFILSTASGLYDPIQEPDGFGSQFGEALFQELILVVGIASRGMLRQAVLLSGGSGRVEFMAGDLRQVRAVNDQLLLGDA